MDIKFLYCPNCRRSAWVKIVKEEGVCVECDRKVLICAECDILLKPPERSLCSICAAGKNHMDTGFSVGVE